MGMDIGRQVVSVVGVEKGRQILYLGQRTTVFRILQVIYEPLNITLLTVRGCARK